MHMDNTSATPLCHMPLVSAIMGLLLWPANKYTDILHQFPQVLTPHFDTSLNKHGVEMHITTTGPPVHSRTRCLDPQKYQLARDEFRRMADLGII